MFCPNCDEICVNEFKINLNFRAKSSNISPPPCKSKPKIFPFKLSRFAVLGYRSLHSFESPENGIEEKKLLMDGNVEDFQHILHGKYLSPPTRAELSWLPSIEVKLSVLQESESKVFH